MSYYGAGDYYGAGGIGSFLKGAARVAISAVTGGPVAAARTAVSAIASRPTAVSSAVAPALTPLQAPPTGSPIGGLGGFAQRVVPGGLSGYYNRREYTKKGTPRRRRRDGQPYGIPTMDAGNTKALMRATRRANSFVKLARRALANTKYTIATRGSRGRKSKR